MSGGMIGGGGVDPPTTTKGDISGFDTTYARIPIGANGQILEADSTEALGLKWQTPSTGVSLSSDNIWTGLQTFTHAGENGNGGKMEYFGEHTNIGEEYDFSWTPTTPISFDDYSAVYCFYSYGLDSTGTSFDLRMMINNDSSTNYSETGTTQSTTTVTGVQNVSQAYFTLSDTSQNSGNSTQISGGFIITSVEDQYQFIKHWADSWNRTTRNFLGHKAEIQTTITTLDFDSSVGTPAGWINGKWQFYGARK